jgi:hypothetical protein
LQTFNGNPKSDYISVVAGIWYIGIRITRTVSVLFTMKLTLHDRILQREIGDRGRYGRYGQIASIYGDKYFVDQLDIVNELEGHNGCVNALRLDAII